jgi:hypothetical protein
MADNDSIVAIVNTDPASGMYNIMLPKAGRYRFKVEADGYLPETQVAEFSEFGDKYFIQEIYLSRNPEGKQNLAIANLRESDILEIPGNLTASQGEDGTGLSASDFAATRAMSGITSIDPFSGMNMNGMEFRVQIGAFKYVTAESAKKKLKKKTDNPEMTNYNNPEWKKFFIGHLATYPKAKDLKEILLAAGFKGAFVVAFKDGIPVGMPVVAAKNEQ